MTLEETARNIVTNLITADKQLLPDDVDFVLDQLRGLIKDEREACAKLAYRYGCVDARDAIRARATP